MRHDTDNVLSVNCFVYIFGMDTVSVDVLGRYQCRQTKRRPSKTGSIPCGNSDCAAWHHCRLTDWCGLILKYPVHEAILISGGLGWYSLAGVTIGNLAGTSVGSVAFFSNLMREITSFILIPFVAKHLNAYTCIAIAGATSEDTTLPMIMRYTDAETAVFSVVDGVVCSTFVPILFSICY